MGKKLQPELGFFHCRLRNVFTAIFCSFECGKPTLLADVCCKITYLNFKNNVYVIFEFWKTTNYTISFAIIFLSNLFHGLEKRKCGLQGTQIVK